MAIVDLIQVDSPEDLGFYASAQPIYDRHGQGHKGPPAPTRDRVEPPIHSVLKADARFAQVSVSQYDWDQTYDAPGYRKLMLSYSVTQMTKVTERTALLDEIESLIESFGGMITRPIVVTITTATLR